jgi:sugar phosphate permease
MALVQLCVIGVFYVVNVVNALSFPAALACLICIICWKCASANTRKMGDAPQRETRRGTLTFKKESTTAIEVEDEDDLR